MSIDSMPLVALLRRSFRTSVVPFVVGLIILAAAYSGWEGYNDAQRTTELVASHATAVTAAAINSQDLLSVQREIKRFGDALRDGGYARMTADISIDGAIIAQIRPSSDVRPPTIDLVRRSQLPNGKELIVTVETSLWGSVWRWLVISVAVSLAGIGMMLAPSRGASDRGGKILARRGGALAHPGEGLLGPGPVALDLSGDDPDEQHVAEAMGLKGAGAVNSL